MALHVYIAPQKPGFNFVVEVPDEDDKKIRRSVRFVKGDFRTEDDVFAEAIDKALAKYPNIGRFCHKADREAAEALARKHREMMSRTGATKGGVTAEAAKMSMDTTLMQRDAELRNQLQNPDAVKEQLAREENLQLTDSAPAPTPPAPVEPEKQSSGNTLLNVNKK